ncbi:hypothetical protein FocTR4_00015261 [Fusarium oxysporum f. sp. cubense]|uniref:Uncharacterized protein n=1 Tax=Fusarium oxysporum f. sp. cubense TaxID=61366 RepID=A0A5C6SWQ8_FUSOC|nr:hypothetical protein FocTR4_00015261 [Fusarium oxysporum f. sp. cubense]
MKKWYSGSACSIKGVQSIVGTTTVKLKQCAKCQARRDAGDEAVNKMGAIIGVLDFVENETGVEHWRYDSEKFQDPGSSIFGQINRFYSITRKA